MWIKHEASRNTGTVKNPGARISSVVGLWLGKQVFANQMTLLNRLFLDQDEAGRAELFTAVEAREFL